MSKKNIACFLILASLVALLTSCLFDTDESSLNNWLSDQGLPDSYKVQTLSIDNLTPISAEVNLDTNPMLANSRFVLGKTSNIVHDIVFDIAFIDSAFFAELKESKGANAYMILSFLKPFYSAAAFPKESLSSREEMDLKISWKLDEGKSKSFVDSVGYIDNLTWLKSLKNWKFDNSADTVAFVSVADSALKLDIPQALIDDLSRVNKACRLQIRISAPNSFKAYRFYGVESIYYPRFWIALNKEKKDYQEFSPFRTSEIIANKESCTDCLVLHGGIFDSLVVEYPSKPILEKLSEFYGDDFPYMEGNGDDVRQAVVMAEMTFSRDDANGSNEMGLPIQVVVGSYIDSAGKIIREMESYKLNKKEILKKGHPNMVFHDGDSLTLQVTYGMRDFINRAKDGRTFKMMMRLGYPVLQEKDTTYANYITADGDSSFVFFSHFDYARYDFTQMMKKPATLKMWLATKRGDK